MAKRKNPHDVTVADLAHMDRAALLAWLEWNDRDGEYREYDFTAEEYREMATRQLGESTASRPKETATPARTGTAALRAAIRRDR